ncbi:hypothetical protein BN871_EA_00040 [Paenibacillus sp. P22]|nr:hypothetical protein BN871_EA_00040 [Paenibacillus sp. P22]
MLKSRLQILNVCCFFLQLEERSLADCRPTIAAHAYKQFCRYENKLHAATG